jgi:hypothetical protein
MEIYAKPFESLMKVLGGFVLFQFFHLAAILVNLFISLLPSSPSTVIENRSNKVQYLAAILRLRFFGYL